MSLVSLYNLVTLRFLRRRTSPSMLRAKDQEYHRSASSDLDIESREPFFGGSEKNSDKECGQGSQKFQIDARVISDAIIGLSDGLTVPFALTAGLSTLGDTRVVVYAGMAELLAGAISMGLGGYLGAKSEQESYTATLSATREKIATSPTEVEDSIKEIFNPYDLPPSLVDDLSARLLNSPELLDFLMRFEHVLPEPASSRAFTCALTIALGYFVGGFVPLLPYILVGPHQVNLGLYWSIGIMAVALFIFGYVKTCYVSGFKTWENVFIGVKGGVEMVVVGGVAAGAAMGLVFIFDRAAQSPR